MDARTMGGGREDWREAVKKSGRDKKTVGGMGAQWEKWEDYNNSVSLCMYMHVYIGIHSLISMKQQVAGWLLVAEFVRQMQLWA